MKAARSSPAAGLRSPRMALSALVATGVVLGAVALVFSPSGPAQAAAPSARRSVTPGRTIFYLAIGASESVGVQPTVTRPHGAPTPRGYARDIVAKEASAGLPLALYAIGCPGETTATMINGRDRCYHPPRTQLSVATAFLAAHRRDRGLVTVDLGFNDLQTCLRHHQAVAPGCVDRVMARLHRLLPYVLGRLHSAAGPRVRFVGVGHYDPFLGDYLDGKIGRTFASTSLRAIQRLDRTEQSIFAAAGMPTANVFAAFGAGLRTPAHWRGYGPVPHDVARVCTLTWMCRAKPFGPNLHPDNAGYRTIAAAIAQVLPAAGWRHGVGVHLAPHQPGASAGGPRSLHHRGAASS